MMKFATIVVLLCISICYSFKFIGFRRWSTGIHAQVENIVEEVEAKTRLDVYLSNVYKQHSRSFFGNLCDSGLIHVNKKTQPKSYKVARGDRIVFNVEEQKASEVQPENIPLSILYEDEHMIAVNKPNGMVVHPAVGSPNGTFVNALLYHIGDQAAQLLKTSPAPASADPEDEDESMLDLPETPEAAKASPVSLRPGIVHRLDKGTTGVLLAGKHPTAVEKLSKTFANRDITKIYLAVCVGHPGDSTIAEPIGRGHKNRQIMVVYDGPPGKPAVTHTRTICFDGKLSVVLVRIETGRTHQIRVHLKHRRTPIIGDETYGTMDWNKRYVKYGVSRPLLHAYETSFVHPLQKKEMCLRAPLPSDLLSLVKKIAENNMQGPLNILDESTGLLAISTEVASQFEGKVKPSGGGTPIITTKGYVPSERIRLEEEDWTSIELPEDPAYFR
jgi:23S rRNA pseudouridine1911/1915/1917 synthase